MNKTILWVVIVIIVVVLAWYFFFRGGQEAVMESGATVEVPALDEALTDEETEAVGEEATQ